MNERTLLAALWRMFATGIVTPAAVEAGRVLSPAVRQRAEYSGLARRRERLRLQARRNWLAAR